MYLWHVKDKGRMSSFFVSLVPKDKDYEQLEAYPTLYSIPRLGKIFVNSLIHRNF